MRAVTVDYLRYLLSTHVSSYDHADRLVSAQSSLHAVFLCREKILFA
jgi:hypothetical protein